MVTKFDPERLLDLGYRCTEFADCAANESVRIEDGGDCLGEITRTEFRLLARLVDTERDRLAKANADQ